MIKGIRCRRPLILSPLGISLLFLAGGAVLSATTAPVAGQSPEPGTAATTSAEPVHEGEHAAGGHTDPFSFILIELALVVIVAMFGRWMAGRFGQPAVLGELLIGVLLGNVGYWLGRPFFIMVMHLGDAGALFREVWHFDISVSEAARHVFSEAQLVEGGIGYELLQIMTGPHGVQNILMGTGLWMFSSLGVILLLFMVGLESSVSEMIKVGTRASMVAVLGIVAPFGLGFLAAVWLLPELDTPAHLFLGATLCATSVGITARVFKDLKALRRSEVKVILGAAVIDDVLGLIILAVVVGIVATGEVRAAEIGRIAILSIIFLGAVMLLGERIARFAAGLILDERQFDEHSQKTTIEELIAPLERIFAPVFFVLMGMQVNVASFLQPGTIVLASALTVVALAGKIICGLPAGRGVDRLSVGLGMVPRGEVGLIFASIGRGLGVVSDSVFSALVVMIMVTTLITPPALTWSMHRRSVEGDD
jgi:Kef-type K+ transport system membrane component KefB